MAISVRIDTVEPLGNSYFISGSFVPDSSWLATGEVIAIADSQHDVTIERINSLWGGGGGYVLQFDKQNQEAMLYRADYDAVADGPLVAVPDTTDLSAQTIQ